MVRLVPGGLTGPEIGQIWRPSWIFWVRFDPVPFKGLKINISVNRVDNIIYDYLHLIHNILQINLEL